MIVRAMLILLPLLLPVAARADARPPRYDINSLCRHLATTPDGVDPQTEQQCLRTQDAARNAVQRVWLETPDYIQRDCDLTARNEGDKDYALLRKCINELTRQIPADQATAPR